MLGDEPGGAPRGFEALGEAAVECPPAPPRDVAVDGLADQRVPEGADAGLGFDQDLPLEQLVQAVIPAGQLRHEIEGEAQAGDSRDLQGRRASRLASP